MKSWKAAAMAFLDSRRHCPCIWWVVVVVVQTQQRLSGLA